MTDRRVRKGTDGGGASAEPRGSQSPHPSRHPPHLAATFDVFCDLPAAERALRLAALDDQDPELAAAVRELLALDAANEGPLERLREDVAGAAERHFTELAPTQPLTELGAWRLGDRLGAGGMGEVWVAYRTAGGFEQRVAIKLVRAGMATEAIVARFLVERQLLARLEHPAIAKVVDGGVAPDGRPWFAMELVAGKPITAYATEHRLGLDERVRLMTKVADAVDFAHRSLVIHRDLKPSNILVDESGEPKLLDFGLAKLLDPEGGPAATRTELVALTPAYAAPEQVLGEPVTTAADVYALGVVLFELVAGARPHRREARSGAGLAAEVERETLVRASVAAAAAAAAAPGGRGDEPAGAFVRRLRGDLDTILLKALAREPERRYASAADFARDLRSWSSGKPVMARPDTLTYRCTKFVRRHALGVSAAALVVVALVAGLIGTTWQARRAARQAARAERVQAFLIDLFEGSDPDRARGRTITARELLTEGAKGLESGLADQPEAKAALLDAVAQIERRLGMTAEAERHARDALALQAVLSGAESRDTVRARIGLAEVLVDRGDAKEARSALEPALAALERRPENAKKEDAGSGGNDDGGGIGGMGGIGGVPDDLTRAESALAGILISLGDQPAGLALGEKQLARELRTHGPSSLEVADARLLLGQFMELGGRFPEARENYRQSVEVLDRGLGAGNSRTETARLALAEVTGYLGDAAKGEALFRQTIDGLVRSRGEGHSLVAQARLKLALLLINQARYAEADHELELALPIFEAIGHFDAASCLRMLGNSLFAQSRYAEAAVRYGQALASFREKLGEEHVLTQMTAANVGAAEVRQGALASGEATLRAAIAALSRLSGDESDMLRQPLQLLGEAERRQGRPAAALVTHRRLLAVAEKTVGAHHTGAATARREIALDLEALGGRSLLADARRELAQAIEIRAAAGGANHPRLAEWFDDAARLARASGAAPAAAAAVQRAAEIRALQKSASAAVPAAPAAPAGAGAKGK
ncbi:MAG: serine/threonine-protein kinase [Thermoanaerobaculia bacterium]